MRIRLVVWLGLLLNLAVPLEGSSIVVGNHYLLTPQTTIDLMISGTEQIGALDLFMTVNGGVGPAPTIVAVDIVGSGTIFFGNNSGQFEYPDADAPPSLRPAVVTTANDGSVLANGLLARVTFDTTNVPAGVYAWSLKNHEFGSTDLGTDASSAFIYPTITDGYLATAAELSFPQPPPITNPPITNPPITNPPITNPPITNPPITNPPITNPPITNPPITNPPTPGGPDDPYYPPYDPNEPPGEQPNIPEPSTVVLGGIGLLALLTIGVRKRARRWHGPHQ